MPDAGESAGAGPVGLERPILAIETSCDETAAAVVASGRRILSSVVASQIELHAPFGGVYPELASRQHVRDILPVVERALSEAGTGFGDLAAVAVTYGPGLPGALLVGVNVAKGISLATGLPLVGVSHLAAHLYSNWLRTSTERDDPAFPHVALIVSGGHTDLVHVRDHGDCEILGSTLDDAAGEAFDKAARLLGLGYPGGPAIEEAAFGGDASAVRLPVAATDSPFDFSFSGLKTALARAADRAASGNTATTADLAASFQAAVVRALVAGIRRALAARDAREVHVAGGVSANRALRDAVSDLGVPFRVPPLWLCTDNAAMVASAAHWALASGRRAPMDLDVVPGLGLPS